MSREASEASLPSGLGQRGRVLRFAMMKAFVWLIDCVALAHTRRSWFHRPGVACRIVSANITPTSQTFFTTRRHHAALPAASHYAHRVALARTGYRCGSTCRVRRAATARVGE